MSKIKDLKAREVLDSRGNPTVEVTAFTEKAMARAMVPSGASTGVHEAWELRDNDPKRYLGKGVLKACENVNGPIKKVLVGMEVSEREKVDNAMIQLDGSPNKSNLGANAILGVSMACARASAQEKGVQFYHSFSKKSGVLPIPFMNIVNGGKHADSGLDIQEVMIIPVGAGSFKEAVRMGSEIFHTLGKLLKDQHLSTAVGDEGGYAPNFAHQEMAFDFVLQAIATAGYKVGEQVYLGIDAAASEFYDDATKSYQFKIGGKKEMLTPQQMVNYWVELMQKYPILSLEDPLAQDDWDAWVALSKRLGRKVQVVGDDLLATNVNRLQMGINKQAANSILIKLNQIGTLTETIDAVDLADASNWTAIISHRSGETEDTTIADFAVAMGTGQIKTGSMCRSERVAKYNRLMEIEAELGENARYLGKEVFFNLDI